MKKTIKQHKFIAKSKATYGQNYSKEYEVKHSKAIYAPIKITSRLQCKAANYGAQEKNIKKSTMQEPYKAKILGLRPGAKLIAIGLDHMHAEASV